MITEEMLISAAGELALATVDSVPMQDHRFSPGFEHRMGGLIRRARHPALYQAMRQAAAVVIAAITVFFALYMTSPKVQAAVNGWFRTVFSNYFQYQTEGTTPPDAQYDYSLPEEFDGYTLVTAVDHDDGILHIYTDASGQMLTFNYILGTGDTSVFLIDIDDHTFTQAYVGDLPADIYIAPTSEVSSFIIWQDPQSNVLLSIQAIADEKQLISYAEKVEKILKK